MEDLPAQSACGTVPVAGRPLLARPGRETDLFNRRQGGEHLRHRAGPERRSGRGAARTTSSLKRMGVPREIRYFAQESNLPLSIGILVDTSGSTRTVLPDEREASLRFLQQVLRPTDRAFVIHFDFEVELLEDLTSSRDRLERAIPAWRRPRCVCSGRLRRPAVSGTRRRWSPRWTGRRHRALRCRLPRGR